MTSLANLFTPRRHLRISRRPPEAIRPASPRPERRDCQGRLLAAIQLLAGPNTQIEDASLRPWCSATFLGAQHRIVLRITGEASMQQSQQLAGRLAEAEFTIPRHIVVDLTVDALCADDKGDAVMTLAALTVEDW